jgi:hypothetical protein
VGSLQFVFEGVDVESDYDSEVTTFRNTMYYDLEASTPVDWKFEHIRIDDADFQVFRSIDFPEMTQRVFPMFNSGWIERVKVDTSYTQVDNSYIGKSIQQLNHPSYSTAPPAATWYGIIRYWDSANRYLYIERPAVWNAELKNGLLGDLLAKKTFPLIVNAGDTPDSSGTTIEITTTATAIQFVGYLMPWFRWDGEVGGSLGPFNATTRYDPFNDNIPEVTGIFSKIFMKVKNRGISVVVPQNITADTITADNIILPTYDLIARIADIETRLTNGNF